MDPPAKTPPPEEPPEEQEAPPADVGVRYLGSGTFSIDGVTGRTYVFRDHGAVLAVDAADTDRLLQMELRRQRCCGRGVQVIRPFAVA